MTLLLVEIAVETDDDGVTPPPLHPPPSDDVCLGDRTLMKGGARPSFSEYIIALRLSPDPNDKNYNPHNTKFGKLQVRLITK